MLEREARRSVLIAAACLALCGGCIKGKVLTYFRYDRATDSFACLEVYANIVTEDERELDHIAKLWNRRANLIIDPSGRFVIFSSPTIIERQGKHSFIRIPVAAKLKKEPQTLATPVDLDAISVKPGKFFLNEYNDLCYYHQSVVSGEAVDTLMRELAPQIAEGFAWAAEREIQLARKEGSKKASWDDVREDLARQLGKEKSLADDKTKGKNLYPLDSASLRLLIRAGAERSVEFTRNADTFSLLVPLSTRDCDEAIATFDLAKEVADERLKSGKPAKKYLAELLEALKAIELRHIEGSGLRVTARVEMLSKLIARMQNSMPAPDADKKLIYRTTVAAIQGRGIAIDMEDKFPAILERFFGAAAVR
jgi:hypothetical protein